jgi:hypothetical protein
VEAAEGVSETSEHPSGRAVEERGVARKGESLPPAPDTFPGGGYSGSLGAVLKFKGT